MYAIHAFGSTTYFKKKKKEGTPPVTGFPPSANHFGNWKLLEIGPFLVTGGTEYLCRILNPSAFGRRAGVLAGRREKTYPGFGAMTPENLFRASRLRGSVRASVLSRSREFSRKQGTVLSATAASRDFRRAGARPGTPGVFSRSLVRPRTTGFFPVVPRMTWNLWDFSRGSLVRPGTPFRCTTTRFEE